MKHRTLPDSNRTPLLGTERAGLETRLGHFLRPSPARRCRKGIRSALRRRSQASGSPTRGEEGVERKGKEPWTYYYPKTILLGVEYDVLPLALGSAGRRIEHRLSFGLNTPLSHRCGKLPLPVLSLRVRVQNTENGGLLFGAGYTGNGGRGPWFVPFGFSYRI